MDCFENVSQIEFSIPEKSSIALPLERDASPVDDFADYSPRLRFTSPTAALEASRLMSTSVASSTISALVVLSDYVRELVLESSLVSVLP